MDKTEQQRAAAERAPTRGLLDRLPLGAFGAYLAAGAVACVLGALAFLWLASEVFEQETTAFDDSLLLWAHSLGPGIGGLMQLLTTLAEAPVLGLLIALVALTLLRFGHWTEATAAIVAAAGAGIINQLLKATYQRVRPDLFPSGQHLTSFSFPSGHTMGSLACFGIVAYIGMRHTRSRAAKVALAVLAALLSIGVGASRVYFGVHFPTDVLGGWIASGIWLVVVIVVVQALEWHAARASHGALAEESAA